MVSYAKNALRLPMVRGRDDSRDKVNVGRSSWQHCMYARILLGWPKRPEDVETQLSHNRVISSFGCYADIFVSLFEDCSEEPEVHRPRLSAGPVQWILAMLLNIAEGRRTSCNSSDPHCDRICLNSQYYCLDVKPMRRVTVFASFGSNQGTAVTSPSVSPLRTQMVSIVCGGVSQVCANQNGVIWLE